MITLAVDAMGGDQGLAVTVPGATAFLQAHPDVRLIMTGDETQLRQALNAAGAPMERIDICHTTQVVGMDESPQSALKNKKYSSMRVAINQVKEGKAQAAVSAGNTGALMATARFVLKTIPGIERPAIAKFLPSDTDHVTLALDLGANVDCTPEQLAQFAVIGSELVHALHPQKDSRASGWSTSAQKTSKVRIPSNKPTNCCKTANSTLSATSKATASCTAKQMSSSPTALSATSCSKPSKAQSNS